jgi:hypothetical protein
MEQWQKDIEARLANGDLRMTGIETDLAENTKLTRQIADNTAGFSSFFNELESGTRFMCRLARGVSWFLKDVVEPFWKPVGVVAIVAYYILNDHKLPEFLTALFKAFA